MSGRTTPVPNVKVYPDFVEATVLLELLDSELREFRLLPRIDINENVPQSVTVTGTYFKKNERVTVTVINLHVLGVMASQDVMTDDHGRFKDTISVGCTTTDGFDALLSARAGTSMEIATSVVFKTNCTLDFQRY
jgi:hypothetical protein